MSPRATSPTPAPSGRVPIHQPPPPTPHPNTQLGPEDRPDARAAPRGRTAPHQVSCRAGVQAQSLGAPPRLRAPGTAQDAPSGGGSCARVIRLRPWRFDTARRPPPRREPAQARDAWSAPARRPQAAPTPPGGPLAPDRSRRGAQPSRATAWVTWVVPLFLWPIPRGWLEPGNRLERAQGPTLQEEGRRTTLADEAPDDSTSGRREQTDPCGCPAHSLWSRRSRPGGCERRARLAVPVPPEHCDQQHAPYDALDVPPGTVVTTSLRRTDAPCSGSPRPRRSPTPPGSWLRSSYTATITSSPGCT